MTTEHLPGCAYGQPCPEEWRNAPTIKADALEYVPHRIVSGSSGRCVECYADEALAADLKAVLVNNGVDIDGGSFHSWRCFDRERYPEPCTCTDEVVAELMDAITKRRQSRKCG